MIGGDNAGREASIARTITKEIVACHRDIKC
jgi:hypothetical protein